MRLTTRLREQIAEKIVHHRFVDEEEAADAAIKAHGAKVWEALFPANERAIMEAAPANMFHRVQSVHVFYGGNTYAHRTTLEFGDARPVTPAFAHYGTPNVKAHPVIDAMLALVSIRKKIAERNAVAYKEVLGVLNGFSSTKSLLKAWPEIEAFVPRDPIVHPITRVPQTLNEKFKLPPETKAVETPVASAKKATKKVAKKRVK